MNRVLVLLAAPLLLAGCATNCVAGSDVGMIRIQSAMLSGSGTAIPTVTLSAFTRNGQVVPARTALEYMQISGTIIKARIEGESVVCDVACAFAHPGSYSFLASAPGAAPQTIQVNIPERKKGWFGCGGVTTGTPVTLDLIFDPAP